jgi:hypothetical protein
MSANGFANGSVGIFLLAHAMGDGEFLLCSKEVRLRASLVIWRMTIICKFFLPLVFY